MGVLQHVYFVLPSWRVYEMQHQQLFSILLSASIVTAFCFHKHRNFGMQALSRIAMGLFLFGATIAYCLATDPENPMMLFRYSGTIALVGWASLIFWIFVTIRWEAFQEKRKRASKENI